MQWNHKLTNWYSKNKRDFPWRDQNDPYKIWLSEIILQQTRVATGIPFYLKFIKKYPNIKKLANADEKEILKNWQGLGYYRRAINLHHTAKFVLKKLNGEFPKKINLLKQLKGIGDYTANAIASICYEVPSSVVDGNVYRFLSRFFGINKKIGTKKVYNSFKKKADKLMRNSKPSEFNQALMEFGSLQCIPKNPKCNICVFKKNCFAFINNKVHYYPVKSKSKKLNKRYFNYLIFKNKLDQKIIIQRLKKDIWFKLYEYPLLESNSIISNSNLIGIELNKTYKIKNSKIELINSIPIIQKLSHQIIYASFWKINLKKLPTFGIKVKSFENYPIPLIVKKYIDTYS
tara:strand:- start:963 stop:1997 length:1035 start_codon:yes stop_codon:yes gene_type:complete